MNELFRDLLHLPEAASPWAEQVDHLHFVVISITMLGAAAVFATALVLVVRNRNRGTHVATLPVRLSLRIEAAMIIALLGLFLGLWLVGFRQYVAARVPPEDALLVDVTAKQWMWKVVDETGRSAIGLVVVPAERDVRIALTSRDVIHSFYVPALRLKQDALPSATTTMWFRASRPGIHPVYCAEYCGLSHSRMAADLVVLSAEDYEAYRAGEIPSLLAQAIAGARSRGFAVEVGSAPEDLVERGRAVAQRHACLTCHTLDGRRAIGPSWRGIYHTHEPLEGGGSALVTDSYISNSIRDPKSQVVRGYAPVMPIFGTQVSDEEVRALIALIRSLESEDAP